MTAVKRHKTPPRPKREYPFVYMVIIVKMPFRKGCSFPKLYPNRETAIEAIHAYIDSVLRNSDMDEAYIDACKYHFRNQIEKMDINKPNTSVSLNSWTISSKAEEKLGIFHIFRLNPEREYQELRKGAF